ncbi:peptidoglycan-binding protein [Streptomyces actuosus]|uniref:Peptidoglycan-binding protein n=1 Tax=Streptomyces actuosus TaxID=1885 RepID=A0ABS2VVK2_STRAS|nr:peptidoglycan-binding protein [Streptomyces actuosus]
MTSPGSDTPPLSGVDGIYGPQTTESVRHFQSDNGLDVDGDAGPRTMTSLTAKVQGWRGQRLLMGSMVTLAMAWQVVRSTADPRALSWGIAPLRMRGGPANRPKPSAPSPNPCATGPGLRLADELLRLRLPEVLYSRGADVPLLHAGERPQRNGSASMVV